MADLALEIDVVPVAGDEIGEGLTVEHRRVLGSQVGRAHVHELLARVPDHSGRGLVRPHDPPVRQRAAARAIGRVLERALEPTTDIDQTGLDERVLGHVAARDDDAVDVFVVEAVRADELEHAGRAVCGDDPQGGGVPEAGTLRRRLPERLDREAAILGVDEVERARPDEVGDGSRRALERTPGWRTGACRRRRR